MEEDWKEQLLQSGGIRSCFLGHAYKSLPSSFLNHQHLPSPLSQRKQKTIWREYKLNSRRYVKDVNYKIWKSEHFTRLFFSFIFSTSRLAETVYFKSIPMYFLTFTHSKERIIGLFHCFLIVGVFSLWLVGCFLVWPFHFIIVICFVKHRWPKKVFLSKVHANFVQFQ